MMSKLSLPTSSSARKEAIERIIAQFLSKTGIKYEEQPRDKRKFLDNIIEKITANKERYVNTRCKWGLIDNPIRLLESFHNQEWELEGVEPFYVRYHKKKRDSQNKKVNQKLNELGNDILTIIPLEKSDFSTINEVVEQITFLIQDQDIEIVDVSNSASRVVNVNTIIQRLRSIEEKDHKKFITSLNKKICKQQNDWKTAMKLEKDLNEYGSEYDIESYVIDFEYLQYLGFGVKIQIGPSVYLFHFDGTYTELLETLKEEIDEHASDFIMCPFCGEEFRRQLIKSMNTCVCGAFVINEESRDGFTNWPLILDDVWAEACSSLKIRIPSFYKKIYIDEFFSNIVYLGTGRTGWKTWMYKLPWEMK